MNEIFGIFFLIIAGLSAVGLPFAISITPLLSSHDHISTYWPLILCTIGIATSVLYFLNIDDNDDWD